MGAREELKGTSLTELARESLARNAGRVVDAASDLAAIAKDTPSVLYALALAAIREVAPSGANERRIKRNRIWQAMAPELTGHRVHALARGNAAMLMDFPLMDGTPLRNASKDAVRTNAEAYYEQADDMRWKSRWLALVAAKLPDGKKTVGQVLSEESLNKLRAEARNAKR